MDKETVITPALVRQYLDYSSETGVLTWRKREYSEHPHLPKHIIDMFNTQKAGNPAASKSTQGYIQVGICHHGKRFMFKGHRLAWAWFHGAWPKKQIDHINGIRHDNRIDNLRDVSHFENHRNRRRHPHNTSGKWGVRWYKNAWEGKFRSGGNNYYCGRFPTKEEAAKAVRAKADSLGLYTKRHGDEP